jgi:hypothetical protein
VSTGWICWGHYKDYTHTRSMFRKNINTSAHFLSSNQSIIRGSGCWAPQPARLEVSGGCRSRPCRRAWTGAVRGRIPWQLMDTHRRGSTEERIGWALDPVPHLPRSNPRSQIHLPSWASRGGEVARWAWAGRVGGGSDDLREKGTTEDLVKKLA